MTQAAAVVEKETNPIVQIRAELKAMDDQFKSALPAHIPAERFARVVMTAIQNTPDLVLADRRSLWNAAMRAAQDGLLPDGREGAIVTYNTKVKVEGKDVWIKKAQWMPMVFGIMKKARNSGDIASITARVVYEGDKFRYWIDDDGEHVMYEPSDTPNSDVVRRVFAMAKTKAGEILVEPMTPAEVEKIRAVSRAKDNGPWVEWWGEMAKKSAIRRLAKRLPMSSDLDDLIRRDDDLYDLEGSRAEAEQSRPRSLVSRLDALAGVSSAADLPAQPTDQASTQSPPFAASTATPASDPTAVSNPSDTGAGDGAVQQGADQARQTTGQDVQQPGAADAPKNAAAYEQHALAWIENAIDADQIEAKWRSERQLRNSVNVDPETRDELAAKVSKKAAQLRAAAANTAKAGA